MWIQPGLRALAVAVGLALAAMVLLHGLTTQAQQIFFYRYVVNPGGVDMGDCRNETAPCRTVQYALSQAGSADRILVADRSDLAGPSFYTGTVGITKSVTLDGAWQATCLVKCDFTPVPCAPQNVVLDAQGAEWTIGVTGTTGLITPTIRCLTIAGAGQPVAGTFGGGIHSRNASLIVEEDVITNNVASAYGGGVYIESGSVMITATDIVSNFAMWSGGGVYLAADVTAALYGSRIAKNRTSNLGTGGALALHRANLTATANLITENLSRLIWETSGDGGQRVTAVNNVLMNNVVVGGTEPKGVVGVGQYQAALLHNVIVSNTNATPPFGADAVKLSNGAVITLANNLLARNSGAGIATVSPTDVVTLMVANNLFWQNGSDPITGTDAVMADPLLAADGYHIRPGSAAIGRGREAGVPTDIDGEFRVGAPDIGVDEYVTRGYLPLVLRSD